jgi:hypothetical protein
MDRCRGQISRVNIHTLPPITNAASVPASNTSTVGPLVSQEFPNMGATRARVARAEASFSRLTLSTAGTVDVARRKARITGGELHVDRGQLGRLARTAQHGRAAEAFLFLR